ncbi:MAG: hypothetical protein JJT94_14755 [Bernardetiaceae bacterium]|nr:hypothetical protein [Bernardetiaceae bacterium]
MCICKLPRYLLYSLPIFLLGWAYAWFFNPQHHQDRDCKPVIERQDKHRVMRGCDIKQEQAVLRQSVANEHKSYISNLLWVNQLIDAQQLPYHKILPHQGYKLTEDFEKSVYIGKYLTYLFYAQFNQQITDSYLYAESVDILAQDLGIDTPIDQLTFSVLVAQKPQFSLTLEYVYMRLMALSAELPKEKQYIFDGIVWGAWLSYMHLQIAAYEQHKDINLAKTALSEITVFAMLYERVFPYLEAEKPSRFSDIQKLKQWQKHVINRTIIEERMSLFSQHIQELHAVRYALKN